jgi:glycosyltransferase involved in cell wall biosynthesis
LLRKPLVTSYHCDLLLPPGFVNRLANLASDFANRVTVSAAGAMVHNTRDGAEHSRFMRRYLHKLYPILPPAEIAPVTDADRVAFREKYNLLPGQRIIGMAARLAAEKGVEILAAALPRVLEKYPTARVLFVGQHAGLRAEEPYAERVMRLVEHLNDHWQFLGVISPVEMSAFFHECEVTVLPSTNSTESYGLVQIESMMCGTPVVASDLPGVRVPVQMTGMGHIVPPGDAQALAEALIAVLDNPAAYQKDASAVVQKSTPEAVAEEYEKVFETVRRRVQHGA